MRLRRFSLKRYGVFEDTALAFDPAPGVVNLVVAGNGEGKSQLVHAVCDFLFGIHGQSPMDFRFDDYAGMRLTAEFDADGATTVLTRRKGTGKTLLDEAGQPADPALLKRWLGSVPDRDRMMGLFALDSHRLRMAEGQLLDSDGALGEALLSGTGELHPVRELKARLEKRRDELGKPGRRTPPLNAAGLEWEQAGRALRAATRSPEQHSAQYRQWRQAAADQNAAETAHKAALAELRRLSRMAVTQPASVQRMGALDALRSLPETPLPDPALTAKLDAAEAALVRAADQLALVRRAAEDAAATVAAYVPPTALLAQADTIDALAGQLGAIEKAAADRPALEQEAAAALQAADALLGSLGLTVEAKDAAATIPARAVAAAARDAIARHDQLQDAALAASSRRQLADADPALSPDWLAGVPGRAIPPGLLALCEAIREDGAVAARHREAQAAVAEATAQLAASLARVPGWDEPAALIGLAPPALAAFTRLQDAVQATGAEARHLRRASGLAEAKSRQAEAAASAKAAGAPPGEDRLTALRARRDAGWELVRLRAFENQVDATGEAAFALQPLDQAFRDAVLAADALADERFRGASTLADLRQAQAERDAAASAARDAVAEADAADAQADAALAAWAACVAPLRLPVGATLDDVRAVLDAREAAIDARAGCDQAQTRAGELARQHAAWAAGLARLLGESADHPGGLSALLAEADRLVREAASFEGERTKRHATAEAAAKGQRAAAADEAKAAAALAGWQAGWAAHLEALRRPPGEHPAVTAGLLGLFEDLRDHLTRAADRQQRIAGISNDHAAFARRVGAVLGRAGPGDSLADLRAVVATLNAARQADALAKDHAASAEKAAKVLRAAEAKQQAAETELRTVLTQCGAANALEARRALDQSAARRDALGRLDAANQVILAAGGGLALDALLVEAATLSPDDLPALRDQADAEAATAADQTRRAAVQANELRRQLDGAETSEDADLALTAQMAALSKAERTAEEALVLHLAATMLDRALKQVEDSRGDAGLARIGTLFSGMTAGRYSRVEAAMVNGKARLRAVELAWPKERKTMHDLSEGTRDQLYLALRTAAIEDHLAVSPALPFIADDILQTWDEPRAAATLAAMVELSRQTQVIIMTHHEHIAALATHLPPGAVHVVRFA